MVYSSGHTYNALIISKIENKCLTPTDHKNEQMHWENHWQVANTINILMAWANEIIFNSFTVHRLRMLFAAWDKSTLALDIILKGHGRGFLLNQT